MTSDPADDAVTPCAWRGLLPRGVALALLAALCALPWSAAAPLRSQELSLRSGERACREVAAGGSISVGIDASSTGPLRLVVEQRGIDVEIEIGARPGSTPTEAHRLDSPQDRQGEESALLGDAGQPVALRARERGAPAGEVCLSLDVSAADLVPAWKALDRASELYALGDRASWREALAVYSEALAGFRAAGEARGEARALYALAVVARLTDSPKDGLSWGTEARAPVAALDGRLAAALANEIGLDHQLLGENEAARASFEEAAELADRASDPFVKAVAASNLCRMDAVAGNLSAARSCYVLARAALARAQAPALEASAAISAGRVEDLLGEPEAALSLYRQTLILEDKVGDEVGRARTLNNLGLLEQELGRFGEAIAAYAEASAKFSALGDRRWQARVKNNLGLAYRRMGRQEEAEVQWQAALPLWREAGDAGGEATTSLNLALAALDQGRPDAARPRIENALAKFRAVSDPRGEGMALAARAKAEAARGETENARTTFGEALARLEAVGDLAQLGDAERALGELELAAHRLAEARPPFERALALARTLEQPRREAEALAALGRLARAEGRLEAAVGLFDESLRMLESERAHLPGAEAQTSFSTLAASASGAAIETALALDRIHPGAGWSLRALARVERSRGRALVERLSQEGIDPAAAIDPSSAARRADLSRRLAAKAERAATSTNPALRDQLRREAAEIAIELDLVEAEARAQTPVARDWIDPPELDPQTFAAALDPDTVVLVFRLGAEQSRVWSLSRGEAGGKVESHDLGPRAEIERAALDLFRSLRRFDPAERVAEAEGLGALGRRLLGPVAPELRRRRVVIETDCALAYLPWAALPVPGSDRSLVDDHQISFVPSLSVLAAVRDRAVRRAPARGLIAAFADPVFAASDPRLQGSAARAAAGARRDEPFERLPASAVEVERILALAPPESAGEPRSVLVGFDAARSALEPAAGAAGLADFRTLHFATHGVIDAASPSLSGLALSRFTPAGESVEGFLHLGDVYRLNLGADLVVLSGCETALGGEVQGEGLVGLARGFLYAGASRVVASLWAVDDRAAAAFMERFYRALWIDRLAPGAALAAAQRAVAAERRTRDPVFWAGWVLLGDAG